MSMEMRLYLIEAPSGDVVTLAEAKEHLRVDHDDEDTLIAALVRACVSHIDGSRGWLGRALLPQTWEMRLPDFKCEMRIPLPPLIEVESVRYYDDDNVLQTVATDVYEVVGVGHDNPASISLAYGQSWPVPAIKREAVLIRFRAGYLDEASGSPLEVSVPETIKSAIKLWVGTLFMQRESINIGNTVNEIPFASEALLAPLQVHYFGEGV